MRIRLRFRAALFTPSDATTLVYRPDAIHSAPKEHLSGRQPCEIASVGTGCSVGAVSTIDLSKVVCLCPVQVSPVQVSEPRGLAESSDAVWVLE